MRWRDGVGMNVYKVQAVMARAFNAVVVQGAHKQLVFAFLIFGFYMSFVMHVRGLRDGSYGQALPHAHGLCLFKRFY